MVDLPLVFSQPSTNYADSQGTDCKTTQSPRPNKPKNKKLFYTLLRTICPISIPFIKFSSNSQLGNVGCPETPSQTQNESSELDFA